MVMVKIILAVGAKPRLHPLRPVLVMVASRIFAFPEFLFHGGVISGFKSLIEGGIRFRKPHAVNSMGEFMDEDVLGGVGIFWIKQQILLSATYCRSLRRGAQAARALVPVEPRLQVPVLRNVGGVFIVRHDGKAHLVFRHCLKDILTPTQHFSNEKCRLLQCVVRYFFRGHNRQSTHIHMLLVKGIEFESLAHFGRGRGDLRTNRVRAQQGANQPKRK